jgi:hypothetical protein
MGNPDYGFDGEPADPVVGLFALRTFRIGKNGKLGSIVMDGGNWADGVCEAKCKVSDPSHPAPQTDCNCGIYGTHGLAALFGQYPRFARRIVTVIAAEGITISGPVGLSTSCARVVAYWCGTAVARPPREAQAARQQFPGARRYPDLEVMAEIYGLGGFDES